MRLHAAAIVVIVIASAGCDLVFPPGTFDQDAMVDAAPPDCAGIPYQSIAGAPSVYRIEAVTVLPWPEAEQTCEADRPGGTHLVVFDDITELLAVRQEMLGLGGFGAYAGYARDPTDPPNMFRTVTGEPLSPVSNLWEPGEPTGGTEQVIYFANDEDLIDGPANFELIYVCECDGKPVTESFTFP